MSILSRLLVALGLDATDYQKGLDGVESTTSSKLSTIGSKLGEMGKKATNLGTNLTAGVSVPLLGLGMVAVDAASDLDESMSKVNVVFGDSAEAVIAFSETAATSLGQSQQEALEAAGTYGNLFSAMGLGADETRDMSLGLVTLASDLASFNNAAPIETLDALRAGLTGETEPLKRFGINLNAAQIAAKALDLGLVETSVDMDKVTKATLDLEKAEAELATMTQGVAKDSIEYKEAKVAVAAAQQKLSKITQAGAVDELALREATIKVTAAQEKQTAAIEKFGEGSTQAQQATVNLEKAQRKLSEVEQGGAIDAVAYQKASIELAKAKEKLATITQGASEDSIEYQEAALKVTDAQNKLDEALAGTAEELTAADKAQASYALIMEQTSLAQGDFIRTSDGLANSTRIAKAQLSDAAATMGAQLLPIGLKIVQFVSDLASKFSNLDPKTQKVILVVAGLAAAVGPLLVVFGSLVSTVGAILPILGSIVAVISGPVLAVVAAIGAAVALLVLAWQNDWLGIKTTLTEVWENTIKPALTMLWEWLKIKVPEAIAVLKTWWDTVFLPAIRRVWQFIQTNVIPLFEALGRLIRVVLAKGVEFLAALWKNKLEPALRVVWQFIQDNVIPIFQAIAAVVEDRLGPILKWLKEKIIDPVASAFGAIGDAISGVIGFINDLITKIQNIQLPSWLQPGSPTPFELGLLGINSELRRMARTEIPAVDRALSGLGGDQFGVGVGALGAGAGAGAGDQIVIHNHGREAAALTMAILEDRRSRRLNLSMG